MDREAARAAFENKYFISSAVKWNGYKYEARDEIAEKEAVIMNNWLDVWCDAAEWATSKTHI